jgi:enamine deaminase RidA (YjgF/YER057c/UK114 family)
MRQNVESPSPFAPAFGFSSAVRVGSHVFVSGTVGRRPDGTFPADRHEQTKQAIENATKALEQAGASLRDVVRTRLYLLDTKNLDDVARAHREAFGDVRPASTLLEIARLASDEMLVEIEIDAVISEG